MCGVIAIAPTVERKMVWPSGSALATKSAPIAPLAPGLFSISTGCGSELLELVGEQAADEVGRAAGREGDHHADRAGGEVLRLGRRGGGGRNEIAAAANGKA